MDTSRDVRSPEGFVNEEKLVREWWELDGEEAKQGYDFRQCPTEGSSGVH